MRENNKKDYNLTIRINKETWAAFQDICNKQDVPASQLIRKYIKDYIDNYKQQQQQEK